LTTPKGTTQVAPKEVMDNRPMDGCLVVSLSRDVVFAECAHDGPTSFELRTIKGTIPLQLEVKGRFFKATEPN
jgi:hypothetical protein